MPNNILQFPATTDDEPTLYGTARCLCCGHEWEAVTPVGEPSGLECPGCHTLMGVLKHPVCAPKGYEFFECGCGADMFNFLQEPATGHMYIQCLKCGDFKQPWNE